MTIQPIGPSGAAVYLTTEDLSPHGLSPATLTLEQARQMVGEACAQAGIPLQGAVEIEAYPGSMGVMLFAHPRQSLPSRPIPRRPFRRGRVRRRPT